MPQALLFDVLVGRRANRTVVAVLVHSEQWVIQRDGALFDLAHRPKLCNRLACPGNENSLAPIYSGNEAREMPLRIGDIDGFAAHTRSLADRGGLIKPAAEPMVAGSRDKSSCVARRKSTANQQLTFPV